MEDTCGSRTPSSLGTKRVACSFGNRRRTGGAFAWAAAKSGPSSGTATKCKLCRNTQWWGPQFCAAAVAAHPLSNSLHAG